MATRNVFMFVLVLLALNVAYGQDISSSSYHDVTPSPLENTIQSSVEAYPTTEPDLELDEVLCWACYSRPRKHNFSEFLNKLVSEKYNLVLGIKKKVPLSYGLWFYCQTYQCKWLWRVFQTADETSVYAVKNSYLCLFMKIGPSNLIQSKIDHHHYQFYWQTSVLVPVGAGGRLQVPRPGDAERVLT